MKSMPLVQKVMTAMPHTIETSQPLSAAKSLMRDHGIRHLPVLDGPKLVGLLSDRDIALASSFAGAADLRVSDVMMSAPYVVRPETPLNQVITEMAERKYGSAVVQQQNGTLVGIFTAVDALLFLADVLKEHYKGA